MAGIAHTSKGVKWGKGIGKNIWLNWRFIYLLNCIHRDVLQRISFLPVIISQFPIGLGTNNQIFLETFGEVKGGKESKIRWSIKALEWNGLAYYDLLVTYRDQLDGLFITES